MKSWTLYANKKLFLKWLFCIFFHRASYEPSVGYSHNSFVTKCGICGRESNEWTYN